MIPPAQDGFTITITYQRMNDNVRTLHTFSISFKKIPRKKETEEPRI